MSQKHFHDSPILVTGCARSGTSLAAGIIHICGAFGGELLGPNSWNQKGMFENLYIRENLVKPYLEAIGADPRGQRPLPVASTCPIVQDWHEMFMDVMKEHGYEDGPIFYKGAKMCLMWPVWHTAFPRAKWVITERDNEGIIASCQQTVFMNTYNDEAGWQGWIDHHKECVNEMWFAGCDGFVINTPDIIQGDLSAAEEMIEWLGLDWDEDAVKEFVSPEIWHGGSDA